VRVEQSESNPVWSAAKLPLTRNLSYVGSAPTVPPEEHLTASFASSIHLILISFDKWLSPFISKKIKAEPVSIKLANEILHVIGWRQTTGWYQQLPR